MMIFPTSERDEILALHNPVLRPVKTIRVVTIALASICTC